MQWFEALLALDRIAFTAVNTHLSQGPAGMLFATASRSADYAAIWLVACLFLAWKARGSKEALRVVTLTLIAILLSELATGLLKAAVGRARPDAVMAGVRLLLPAAGFSFPSGHAARSFAAAVVLSRGFRGWSWVLYLIAALVALARVVVGAHFPLDVVGGALLGGLVGWVTVRVGGRWPAKTG